MSQTTRRLLACGPLVPLLYAAADVLAGSLTPGYSFRDQTISELGAIGAPSRALFSGLLVLVYLLLAAFGVGVWRSTEGSRNLKVVAALLVALGVMALTVGQFVSMQTRGNEQGLAGALHLAEGALAMAMVAAAMAFGAATLGARFRWYTLATAAVMFSFGLWSTTSIPRISEGLATPWVGVIERIFRYDYQLWFAVLALTLLRRGVTAPASGVSYEEPSPAPMTTTTTPDAWSRS